MILRDILSKEISLFTCVHVKATFGYHHLFNFRRNSIDRELRKRDDLTYDNSRRERSDQDDHTKERRNCEKLKSTYWRENGCNSNRDNKVRRDNMSFNGKNPLPFSEDVDDRSGYKEDDSRYKQETSPLKSEMSYTRHRKLSNGQVSEISSCNSSRHFSTNKNNELKTSRLKSEVSSRKLTSISALSRMDSGDSPGIDDELSNSTAGNRKENYTHPKKHYRGRRKR